MDDSKIIELFFERSENAIVELSEKYGDICMKTAFNIIGNKEDSEECIHDSYLGVWNKIPPERPKSLLAFLLSIVRNISINRYEYNSRQKRAGNYGACLDELEWHISSVETPETELDATILSSYIDEFLDTLNKNNRMLFVRRYWYMDSYKELSKITGLNENALRTRLSRIRDNLRKYLNERGVII